MAQGQVASVFVRLYLADGDDRWAAAALRALEPLVRGHAGRRDSRVSRRRARGSRMYPTEPPSFVLNGGLFAVWGLYDAAVGLGDARARSEFEACARTFAANAHRWDTGRWSRYDLFPHPFLVNVASLAYHALHTNQLRAMQRIAPDAARSRGAGALRALRPVAGQARGGVRGEVGVQAGRAAQPAAGARLAGADA